MFFFFTAVAAFSALAGRGRLYVGGYPCARLARALFPERGEPLVLEDGGFFGRLYDRSTRDDVLVFGMHGPNSRALRRFRGRVLLVNGEHDIDAAAFTGSKKTFYLGPTGAESAHHMQFDYASVAAFRAGAAFLDEAASRSGTRPPRFLSYISSNCKGHRDRAFDDIIAAARAWSPGPGPGPGLGVRAAAGGRCHGSHPELKETLGGDGIGAWEHNRELSGFRFALTMDSRKSTGYVTEKIVNGFLSGAIPIYWGTEEGFRLFNRDAFVYYDVDNPRPALDQIRRLETNATAYAEMKARPMLADGALEAFFSLSDDIGGGRLKQRIRDMVYSRGRVE